MDDSGPALESPRAKKYGQPRALHSAPLLVVIPPLCVSTRQRYGDDDAVPQEGASLPCAITYVCEVAILACIRPPDSGAAVPEAVLMAVDGAWLRVFIPG